MFYKNTNKKLLFKLLNGFILNKLKIQLKLIVHNILVIYYTNILNNYIILNDIILINYNINFLIFNLKIKF